MHPRWSSLLSIGVAVAACSRSTREEPTASPVDRPDSTAAVVAAPPPLPPPLGAGPPPATLRRFGDSPFLTAPRHRLASSTPPTLSTETRAQVVMLLGAQEFALGGVGFSGQELAALLAAETLAAEADAVEIFDWVAVNGTAAARLYAYLGLRTLDPARAAEHANQMQHDPGDVSTMSGCMMSSSTVAQIAASFETSAATLPRPHKRRR